MSNPTLDLSRLSRDEQFDLLDRLWETLGRDPKALPLSDAQKAELDQRLDELKVEGPVGLTWDEVVDLLSLRGVLKPKARGVTVEDMNETIRKVAGGA